MALNFVQDELEVELKKTATAGELLFEGYVDELMLVARSYRQLFDTTLPVEFDRVGWMYLVCAMLYR